MVKTRSAPCSSTMEYDHALPEEDELEKHGQHYAQGRWSRITHSLTETNRRDTFSTGLEDGEIRSRTPWKRWMGETRSALDSRIMRQDRALPKRDGWEKQDQHYAPGQWNTITHKLKETNESNTISTMLQHNETQSRTRWTGGVPPVLGSRSIWTREIWETRSTLLSRTDTITYMLKEETWSVIGSETMGHDYPLPEGENMETRSAFGSGTMGHDHAQAEGEAREKQVASQ